MPHSQGGCANRFQRYGGQERAIPPTGRETRSPTTNPDRLTPHGRQGKCPVQRNPCSDCIHQPTRRPGRTSADSARLNSVRRDRWSTTAAFTPTCKLERFPDSQLANLADPCHSKWPIRNVMRSAEAYRPSDYENYVRLASAIAANFAQIKYLPRFRRRLVAPNHSQEVAGGTLKTVPGLNFRETHPE